MNELTLSRNTFESKYTVRGAVLSFAFNPILHGLFSHAVLQEAFSFFSFLDDIFVLW